MAWICSSTKEEAYMPNERSVFPAERSLASYGMQEAVRDDGPKPRLKNGKPYCYNCGKTVFLSLRKPEDYPRDAVHGIEGDGGTPERCDICYEATAGTSLT